MSADERIGSGSRARLAADLAIAGGRLALERFHRAQTIRGTGAAVSDADLAIHDTLGREIARLFPGDRLVGDEPSVGEWPGSSAHYAWVLGALGDSADFVRGMPGFTVSVGVLRGGMPFAGAVYDPVARWLFSGCIGRGSWLNDRPLRAHGDGAPGPALFAARMPRADGVPAYVARWLLRYAVRSDGSTALHLCYVALGGLDFVHDDRASLRDIAGAVPVLLEAGALLTTDAGTALFPLSPCLATATPIAFLAGHPRAHADALRDLLASRTATAAAETPDPPYASNRSTMTQSRQRPSSCAWRR